MRLGQTAILSSGLAATACQEEGQHDDCRRRQEKAVIQSPAGAEERVDHDAREDDDEREHQPDTDPVPVSMAEHLRTIRRVRDARRSKAGLVVECSCDIPQRWHIPVRDYWKRIDWTIWVISRASRMLGSLVTAAKTRCLLPTSTIQALILSPASVWFQKAPLSGTARFGSTGSGAAQPGSLSAWPNKPTREGW